MMLRRLRARFDALRHWNRQQADLDEEIRFHLAEEAEEQRARGVSAGDARRAALREFGNVARVREDTREIWGWGAVERLAQDLRQAYRSLRSAPIVSLVAILSLALGIGANTAIFSVVNALVVRQLPVVEPARLAVLGRDRGGTAEWTNPIWELFRARADFFDGAFAMSSDRFNLATHGETDVVGGLWASGEAFDILGVRPFMGRPFTRDDDRPGGGTAGPVAIISHAFWQRRFGGAPDVLGRTLTVERIPFTIVGVIPPEFFGMDVGRRFDVALPIGTATLIKGPGVLTQRSMWWLRVVVRLKPGQTLEQGTAFVRAIQPQIRAATTPADWHPSTIGRYLADGFRLEPAATGDSDLRQRFQRPLMTIMVVVGLVLLIACANLANLLLARGAVRARELSLRLALGASRLRILRQLLTESLILAIAGAGLGLAVAVWGSRALIAELAMSTPVVLDLSLDWRVLGFTAVAAVTTALLFGTAPALAGTRLQPTDALKAGGRGVVGGRGITAGQVLVALQVALSLVLLVAAGLFIRTFASLNQLNLGFDRHAVLVASVEIPASRVEREQRPEILRQLLDAARVVPGVSSAALSSITPLGGETWNNLVELPDLPQLPEEQRLTYFNRVTPGWFRTYGTPLLAGRDFSAEDTLGSPPVAIVNEAFARRFTNGANPIGVRVLHPWNIERRIVGYVADAVYESIRAEVPPTLYIPYSQDNQPPLSTAVSVRASSGSPELLIEPLVAALSDVHRDLVVTPRPLSRQIDVASSRERMVARLSALFGALALLLAALGLYGITAYAVSQRRMEIGVRMALGAATGAVVQLILRRVLLLVGSGIVLGAAVSVGASSYVTPLLFGLGPRDPVTISIAIALLATIGILVGWLPARRASRIDPADVLREG
jgi:predicted permease